MELENIERGPTAALRNGVSGSFTCDREKERDFIEMILYSALPVAKEGCSFLHTKIPWIITREDFWPVWEPGSIVTTAVSGSMTFSPFFFSGCSVGVTWERGCL